MAYRHNVIDIECRMDRMSVTNGCLNRL